MTTLLVELFTEELPPRALAGLGRDFSALLLKRLVQDQFCSTQAHTHAYATPRRLAVAIEGVLARSPDQQVREKVLPVQVALDAQGQPSAPLRKKLAAMGLAHLSPADLERAPDGKGEAFFIQRAVPGRSLTEGLQDALNEAIARLPIPKKMNYQLHAGRPDAVDVEFVRPVHHLVALHGENVIPVHAFGRNADRITGGHRFLGSAHIELRDADDYARALHEEGRVIASFAERRDAIREGLVRAAGDSAVLMPDGLLDEVTALVEWPVVYAGEFETAFLEVPQECLILTMQQNQKYFALTDAAGRMQNRFLLVSNLQTDDPSAIIGGNERVLRARLSDARFFFDQDRKKSLESRITGLSKIVYHNKLGTQGERMERVRVIAQAIGQALGGDALAAQADATARLVKTDLLTDMVGEFPELQGIMGGYYARHDGLPEDIACAIEDHYKPRFAGDSLPRNDIGVVVALADKLETLAGMFGIGNQPTGDKDPFALRRHALGVLRMLVERKLPLDWPTLAGFAFDSFKDIANFQRAIPELSAFLYDRLRGLLRDEGYNANEIEAVVSQQPTRIDLVPQRLAAVRAFMALPEAAGLAAANKRIGNILKKNPVAAGTTECPVNESLLSEPAEIALAQALKRVTPQAEDFYGSADFTAMLQSLAALHAPVDRFFDEVMVMADDPAVRDNRLAMLASLHELMNRVADLSRLAT